MGVFNFSQGFWVDTDSDGTNDAAASSVVVDAFAGTYVAYFDPVRVTFPTGGAAVGATSITGTNGKDFIQADDADTTVLGLDGDDEINGFLGNDTLRGGAGADELDDDGGSLVDIDGGEGDDVISLFSVFNGGKVAGGADDDELVTLRSMDLSVLMLAGLEVLATDGNIVTATASQFEGFTRIQEFHGEPDDGHGADDEQAHGHTFAKPVTAGPLHHNPGGAGSVTLVVAASCSATIVDLADELNETAATITGSDDGEAITSGEGGDTLHGDGGNDILRGGDGEDELEGESGNDTLYGGDQADVLDGGDGIDFVRYDDGVSYGFRASIRDPSLNTGAAAGDTYDAIEGIIAGAGNDTLSGDDGTNYLCGLSGNDRLAGGDGADRLSGGAGIDIADYSDGDHGNITISLSTPSRNTGAAAGDTYFSIEGILGGSSSERISGNGYQNYLYGYGGDDVIAGNRGNDVLFGGGGADTFVFNAALDAAFNVDRILDFTSGDDTIAIDRTFFGGLALGALDASRFHIAASAADTDDRIIYNATDGVLLFDTNGSGAGGETPFARVAPGLAFTADDFVVIA